MNKQKRNHFLSFILAWCPAMLFISILYGCGMKPIANGSQIDMPYPGTRIVVWGSHPGAVGQVVNSLQNMGMKIVERSRLKQIFDEQKLIVTNSSDDESNVLMAGKIIGAGLIVFVDVQVSSNVASSSFAYQHAASSKSSTVYHTSVSVRAVAVDTGEVQWSGTAHYPKGIDNPEAGIIYLTNSALQRSMCPGKHWDNMSGCNWVQLRGSGRIGFTYGRKELPNGQQLIVTDVTRNLPADRAGLKVDDILLSCNGNKIQNALQLNNFCKVDEGQSITIEVKRNDAIIDIIAKAISRKDQ